MATNDASLSGGSGGEFGEELPVDHGELVLDDKATDEEMEFEWETIFWEQSQ